MNKNIFSNKIKELRKYNKINQKEFAKSINVTQSALSMYENGTNLPSVDVISKIVETYNLSYDWFFGVEEKSMTFLTPVDMVKFLLSFENSDELSIHYYEDTKTLISSGKKVHKSRFELIPHKFANEVIAFFSEYEEIKEKTASLNDPSFQKQVIDMWQEKRIAELSDSTENTINTPSEDE